MSQYPGLCEAEPFSRLAGEALTWLREAGRKAIRGGRAGAVAGGRAIACSSSNPEQWRPGAGGEESAPGRIGFAGVFSPEALAGEGQVTASFGGHDVRLLGPLTPSICKSWRSGSPEFADFVAGRLTSHGLRGRCSARYDRVPGGIPSNPVWPSGSSGSCIPMR